MKQDGSPGMHGGKQRPSRAFARFARVRGEAAQFSAPSGRCAPRKSGRASPKRTPGTGPETRRQRHCARGAAAGGMLSARPLIREPGAAGFGRRPTGGGAGSQGIWPQAILIENPARKAGSAKRTQAGAAGRSARERPSRVARAGHPPKASSQDSGPLGRVAGRLPTGHPKGACGPL